jgi:hypothetical protein
MLLSMTGYLPGHLPGPSNDDRTFTHTCPYTRSLSRSLLKTTGLLASLLEIRKKHSEIASVSEISVVINRLLSAH